jgi:hypothetical protein
MALHKPFGLGLSKRAAHAVNINSHQFGNLSGCARVFEDEEQNTHGRGHWARVPHEFPPMARRHFSR